MASFGDLQRPDRPVGPEVLPLDVTAVRTFDTPEFAGMTFLEVETKSALNKVRGMGFGWSINPYRGCSHACSYCVSGETPILMADGRTRELAQLRAGDEVYGTIQAGAYRRYVVTKVLDHWQTVKRAYRITLEDGTTLVASGDHRFLSNRGWKHVIGAEQGPLQRPHLTTNIRLVGTGLFEEAPKESEAYRRGYLCGMIRGNQPGSAGDDAEALARVEEYTAALAGSAAESGWPQKEDDGWSRGFLAGIFDAEGSYGTGILRIHNNDEVILDAVIAALGRFDIPHILEPPRPTRCQAVRVTGGLRQHLRFFHLTDPAIRRKCNIEGRAVKGPSDLHVRKIEDLGVSIPMYDITTGTGDFVANGVVSHNCFARPTHAYLNLNPLGDFERTVVVKTNVVEVLKRELAKPSWKGEAVAMGTNTDPYQRCEGRYRLMPGIISALAQSRTPLSILTKGTLITRDLEHLVAAAQLVPVTAAMTVGMLDEQLWRSSEPGTPSPAARLAAVQALNEAGIPTGVMLAPIMPGLNDDQEQLAQLVDRCVVAGATHVTPIVLHLRPGVREVFWPWLTEHHPELVTRYADLYRRSDARDDYRAAVVTFVEAQRSAAWRRHGRPAAPGVNPLTRSALHRAAKLRGNGASGGEQLHLL